MAVSYTCNTCPSLYCAGYDQLLLSPSTTRTPVTYDISPILVTDLSETLPILFTSNVTSAFTNDLSLVINEGILLPGNLYRFRLEVSDTQGHTGFAEVDVATDTSPLAGYIELQPLQGYPLVTKFTMRALQWTDEIDKTPLSYQFGFQYPCGTDKEDVYWLTGVLTQNQLSTILPLTHCGSIDIALRVYNQNGAFVEHISPLSLDNTSVSINLLSAIQTIELMSLQEGNWIEGMASLMSFAVSINSNQAVFVEVQAFKAQALDLILRLYDSSIPSSRLFLNQLLSVMLEMSRNVSLAQATFSKVTSLLESVVTLYNSYNGTDFSPGLSQEEAEMIFTIYAHLVSANSIYDGDRIKMNTLTESLLKTITKLGYGICLQQGISETATTLIAEDLGTLKSSYINLPVDYNSTIVCMDSPFGPEEQIFVDFGNELFQRYLQRQCSSKESGNEATVNSSQCSGVCVVSAQFRQDLRWQGSMHSSQTKAPFLQVSLVDPLTGSMLEISNLISTVQLNFPIANSTFDLDQLECVFWSKISSSWSTGECNTIRVLVRNVCYS